MTSGRLSVDKNLDIDASPLTGGITIDGNGSSQIFYFTSDTTNILRGLILTNGYHVSWGGSAVCLKNNSILMLDNCVLSGNTASYGGGILNEGMLTLSRTTLSDNSAATSHGGGIYNNVSGTLTINNSTLRANSAINNGGGIYNRGTLTLNKSTMSHNSATDYGGGIYNNWDGSSTLDNSTLTGNSSEFYGGGIFNDWGGALTLNNSTLSVNSATNSGGGIFIAYDDDVTLTNTIVAGNTAPTDANISGVFSGTGNLTSGDPLLEPLGDFGGPTQTMPPLTNSPAIDAGLDTGSLPATDQRGYPRFSGSAVDIGAVEFQSLVVQNTNDSGPESLRQVIANAGSRDTITFAKTLSGQTIVLTNGQLVVDKDLIIDASDLPAGVAIDGNGESGIFKFSSGTRNFLNGLILVNGYNNQGGAIYMSSASSLTISNTTLIGNSAGDGGGIYNYHGRLNLINCSVSSNSAGMGGGIYVFSHSMTDLYNSTLNGNSATGHGGSLYILDGMVNLNNSTLSGNSSWGQGGAIYIFGGSALLESSTLNGNSTGYYGGGIYNNDYGGLTLINTIVAGNTAPTDANISGTFSGASNLTSGDPLLAPLGNYGGPTQTMPPLLGSPAIDAGLDTGSLATTDQRGYPRIINGAVDIGACESFCITDSQPTASGCALEWMMPATGWNSVVKFSTNLVEMPFVDLSVPMAYPLNIYTDTVRGASDQCFYRVEMVP